MSLHLKLLLTAIFWGATPTIARFLAVFEAPLVIVCGRFVVAATVLVGVLLISRQMQKLPVRLWWRFLVLGVSGIALHNGLMFKGVEYTTATTASIILALIAIQVVVLDLLIYRRRPERVAVLGVLLALAGTLVVITGGDVLAIATVGIGGGEILVFFSGLAWALYSVIGREVLEEYSALLVTTYATLIGLIFLLPALFLEPAATRAVYSDTQAIALIVFLGFVGSALGFLWYYEAVASVGTVGTVIYMNLVPVFGVLAAGIFLGEPLSPALFAGGALVLSGVLLVNIPASAYTNAWSRLQR